MTQCFVAGTVSGSGLVGGLVGVNDGVVNQCYSEGEAIGLGYVGGLIGYNRWGMICTSYSQASVNGGYPVGGLTGSNGSTITQCYSTGKVSGDGDGVGGFAGYNYISGNDSISSSFRDIETSGQMISTGDAIGMNTIEMQTATTFLDAGWDFVNETTNGTEDIWWILEGQDYPRLWWELPGEDGAELDAN